jgi:hypothetical protein
MNQKETLQQVTETLRDDGDYYLSSDNMTCRFFFAAKDETMQVGFDSVSTYIEEGSEWASFYVDELDDAVFSICNEQNTYWPHWLFEEFSHIENYSELRPTDEYETRYQLKENRGIKASK